MFGSDTSDSFDSEAFAKSGALFQRRKFLAMAAASTAAWIASMERSEARNSLFHKIPKEWYKIHGREVYDYARFLERLRLRRIDTLAILRPHFNKRGRVRNILPPKSMWRNIRTTLRVGDKLSAIMRKDVRSVTSVYRSPRYNRMVGGKSRSYHMRNNALDIKFDCSPYYAARVARKMRDKGYFRGGVGDYSSFIHIDTRGHNVDW